MYCVICLWNSKELCEDRFIAKKNMKIGSVQKRILIKSYEYLTICKYFQNYPENFRGNTWDFIWSSMKSSLCRQEKKNAHLACGEGRWLARSIRTEAFYKLLTWTRLENNLQCQFQKNSFGSFWYFSKSSSTDASINYP